MQKKWFWILMILVVLIGGVIVWRSSGQAMVSSSVESQDLPAPTPTPTPVPIDSTTDLEAAVDDLTPEDFNQDFQRLD